ncbi:MAG: hypothetical protein AWU59_2633 [Methanolobus sp. T82-4]|nr:MAG: hypothetical protein AWU59_2633 [Methanolobus sp. T82-4]
MIYKRILLFLLLMVVIVAGTQTAFATSEMLDEFNQEYDTNGTRLDNCTVCHGESIESLNPYGLDYQENDADLLAVEPLDSDEDGFSNQEEIDALTFPGDPEDMPESVAEEEESVVEETPDEEEPVNDTGTDQQTPGFEAILGVAGLLMAIFLLKKK